MNIKYLIGLFYVQFVVDSGMEKGNNFEQTIEKFN